MYDRVRRETATSSPGLRYRDVGAAVTWLCQAFGFEKLSVSAAADGRVTYAELAFGNTIIMLGAVEGFDIDRYMAQPDDIGGAETQCCYFVVEDIDAHYARACEGGCQVVIGLRTHDNGDRSYTCRDPEGHIWTFGTYDPWAAHMPAAEGGEPAARSVRGHVRASLPTRLVAGLTIATIVSSVGALWLYGQLWSTAREATAAPALVIGPEFARAIQKERRRLMIERSARLKAQRASLAAREEAARERTLRVSAQEEARNLAEQLSLAVSAKQAALTAADTARNAEAEESLRLAERIKEELAAERRAREEAERAAAEARAAEQQAKQVAERAAAEAKAAEQRVLEEAKRAAAESQAAERRAREEAERKAAEAQAKLAELEVAQQAAERAKREEESRVAFVSEDARQSTEAALAEIRKKLEEEQLARAVAEESARAAQAELARERSSKQAAWQAVTDLRRRLAKAQGVPITQTVTSSTTTNAAKANKAKKYQPAPAAKPAPPPPAAQGPDIDAWNLYNGPAF